MKYPEINSINRPAKKLIVFLHGLGSDGEDLIALVPYIQSELPDYYFISPHGIESYDSAPFGRQWFSLQDRSPPKIKNLLSASAQGAEKIIKAKQEELGVDNSNTVLIGFSQGTMLALYLNLISEKPFFKIIGFSGVLIEPEVCKNITTPICLIHGAADEVVDVSALDLASNYLSTRNITHKIYKIPNLAHSIDSKALELAVKFIKEGL